jgi:hypothetical protein
MEIFLNLSKRCIETEAKRIYEASLQQYFRAPDSEKPGLEEKIEGLKNFLESSDFNRLRSSHPVLSGIEGGNAVLHIIKKNSFEVEIAGQRPIIVPP